MDVLSLLPTKIRDICHGLNCRPLHRILLLPSYKNGSARIFDGTELLTPNPLPLRTGDLCLSKSVPS